MSDRPNSIAARQHPAPTPTTPAVRPTDTPGQTGLAIRIVVMALLAVDGILSALGAAFFLPSYIGSVPFPISALVSGILNAALVWAALRWTESARVATVPLWTWLLTVALTTLGGPGDDVILGGHGVMAYGALLLIALGVAPPAWLLWRRRNVIRPAQKAPLP